MISNDISSCDVCGSIVEFKPANHCGLKWYFYR